MILGFICWNITFSKMHCCYKATKPFLRRIQIKIQICFMKTCF